MYAQTRPRFILSSEGVLGGMEFEPMLTPRGKSPLPKMSPVEDRTRDAVDSEPKHYQLSYSGPAGPLKPGSDPWSTALRRGGRLIAGPLGRSVSGIRTRDLPFSRRKPHRWATGPGKAESDPWFNALRRGRHLTAGPLRRSVRRGLFVCWLLLNVPAEVLNYMELKLSRCVQADLSLGYTFTVAR